MTTRAGRATAAALLAFAVATVFAREYRHRKWAPWLAYGSAGLIAASRVALGRHFVSDVVVGAVLGHSFGKMVLTRQYGEDERPGGRIQPIFDPVTGAPGLAYRYTW